MCLPPTDDVAYSSEGRKRPSSVALPRRRPTMLPVVHHHHDATDDDTPGVSFRPSHELHQVFTVPTSLSSLEGGFEQRHLLWYNRDDIKAFRREAADLSQQLRDGEDVTENTRGLELRTSLQRQDRKHMIVRRILDAQDEDSTPEELAQIAKEHSLWSIKLARDQAHKDYYSAYHPTLTSVLPGMPALLDCHKDVSTKKRSLLGGSLTQTGRRVRCRMF